MRKKEELIERIAVRIENLESENATEFSTKLYDEIRASILTPKVVALLKAIGSKPTNHLACEFFRDKWDHCGIEQMKADYKTCPLLTSEELKELTE